MTLRSRAIQLDEGWMHAHPTAGCGQLDMMIMLTNSTVAVSGFPQCKYNFELSTGSSMTGNWFRCVKRQ